MNPALRAIQQRRAGELSTHVGELDGKLVIAQSQDCTGIAEWAKVQQNAGLHGSSEMRHAARIPDVIINAYMNETGVTFAELMRDPVHMKRICNDPKNAAFRIWKGAL